MEEFLEHLEYAQLLGYTSLIVIIITYITHRIFKRSNRAIKYLPGMFFIVIGLYNLYTVGNDLTRSAGISNLVLFIIGVGSGFIGLLFGLILGVYNKDKKKKRKKRKKPKENQLLDNKEID